ncbi:hypothetical protein BJX99DRAFT_241900 [Aspergillus californicus]
MMAGRSAGDRRVEIYTEYMQMISECLAGTGTSNTIIATATSVNSVFLLVFVLTFHPHSPGQFN